MANISNEILTITEPSIELDTIEIINVESGDSATGTLVPSKVVGGFIPYVVINKLEISLDDLRRFELNTRGFVPTLSISFTDKNN